MGIALDLLLSVLVSGIAGGSGTSTHSDVATQKVTLIFFLGGVTYAEIAALRFLSQQDDSTYWTQYGSCTHNVEWVLDPGLATLGGGERFFLCVSCVPDVTPSGGGALSHTNRDVSSVTPSV